MSIAIVSAIAAIIIAIFVADARRRDGRTAAADRVRRKIREAKETAACIDPFTGQALVEPTEDLRILAQEGEVVVRVNRETAQKYRLHGLEPFRAKADALRYETGFGAYCRLGTDASFELAGDPAFFYGLLLGDEEFEEAYDALVTKNASIDRYACHFEGQREHDELMEEAQDVIAACGMAVREEVEFDDEPTAPMMRMPGMTSAEASSATERRIDPFSMPADSDE